MEAGPTSDPSAAEPAPVSVDYASFEAGPGETWWMGQAAAADTHPVSEAISLSGPEADAPLSALTPASATFTNAGTFLMGLSATRWPIDLLNGDAFLRSGPSR